MRIVWLALGWCAGIIAASTFSQLDARFWVIAISVTMLGLPFLWSTRFRWLFLIVCAVLLGGFRYAIVPQTSPIVAYAGYNVSLDGVVIAEPDRRDTRTDLTVAVSGVFNGAEWRGTAGTVLVRAPGYVDVPPGARIVSQGTLRIPAEFDTFSYRDYLNRSGIHVILDRASVTALAELPPPLITGVLSDLKSAAQRQINAALPDPAAALLSGILLGNERGISPELADDFSRAGASHIIAISGFNMVVLAAIIMNMLTRARVTRRWTIVVTGVVIIAYTLLVGASGGVLRAAVMTLILLFGTVLQRRTYLPASVAAASLGLLMLNPMWLWDVSFQLSVAAVLGIALFTPPFTRWFDALLERILPPKVASTVGVWLQEPLVVSVAATLMTAPLIALYFQRLSLVSLLVNVLIVPAQPILLALGALAVVSSFILPAVGQVFFYGCWLVLMWTINIVRGFAALPTADVPVMIEPEIVFLFFFVVIGTAMLQATQPDWWQRLAALIRSRPVLNATFASGVGVVLLLVAILMSRPDGRFHVWWLAMGDSNAVLMQTPSGAQVLIDGGRFPSRLLTALGDRMPFYDRTLEMVIITHPDEYNIGAMPAVLQRYDAGVVVTTGQTFTGDFGDTLFESLDDQQMAHLQAGYSMTLSDGVMVEVLAPDAVPEAGTRSDESSMVLRVTYGDASFLITSDATFPMLSTTETPPAYTHATVMQVPQHGVSRAMSNQFVTAVSPQIAVLQVDPASRLNLPEPDTIHRLADIPLYRTDESGAIHMWTDGSTLWTLSN